MANVASLSEAQARALGKYLSKHLPESLDELVAELGLEDAFRVKQLEERLRKVNGEVTG